MKILGTLKNKSGELKAQQVEYTNSGIELAFIIDDGCFGDFYKYRPYDFESDELGKVKVIFDSEYYKPFDNMNNICYTIYKFIVKE